MDQLSPDDRLNVHDYRHGLKLLRDTGDTAQYVNKEGYNCPVCSRTFERLLVSEKRHSRFDPDHDRPFCIRLEDDRFIMFVH